MRSVGQAAVRVCAGLLVSALCALPQNYTVSARPGAVNYIEGEAAINGQIIQTKGAAGKVFLRASDVLSTDNGKVEFLLTPGVFVRLGENSELRMVSPDLTATQVELTQGSAMVEVDQLVKENNIQVLDSGATVKLQKMGLYRFTAGSHPLVQTLDGKADVTLDDKTVEVGKNHQVALNGELKRDKLDEDVKDTTLYAWSKVRDEYDAAASYASARSYAPGMDPYGSGYAGGYYGGYSGFAPGWSWNPYWSSFAWIPGDGAFFSPFGYGFYSPIYVGYAPVVVRPVGGKPVSVPVTTAKPALATAGTRAGYFEGQRIQNLHPAGPARAAIGSSGSAPRSSGYTGSSSLPAPRMSSSSSGMPHGSGGVSHH